MEWGVAKTGTYGFAYDAFQYTIQAFKFDFKVKSTYKNLFMNCEGFSTFSPSSFYMVATKTWPSSMLSPMQSLHGLEDASKSYLAFSSCPTYCY